ISSKPYNSYGGFCLLCELVRTHNIFDRITGFTGFNYPVHPVNPVSAVNPAAHIKEYRPRCFSNACRCAG
ncbi:MAG: hypothetical protein O8C60_06275, partial [Candidatus Methanoperedens sp.]|nr:hypothetical protein [Candidatus Methanoperedens sp.]